MFPADASVLDGCVRRKGPVNHISLESVVGGTEGVCVGQRS